ARDASEKAGSPLEPPASGDGRHPAVMSSIASVDLAARNARSGPVRRQPRPAGRPLRTFSSRLTSLRHGRRVGERQNVQTIGRQLLPLPAVSPWQPNLDIHGARVVSEPEVGP